MELNQDAANLHGLRAKSARRELGSVSCLCVVLAALCIVQVLGCWVLTAMELPCTNLCSPRY